MENHVSFFLLRVLNRTFEDSFMKTTAKECKSVPHQEAATGLNR